VTYKDKTLEIAHTKPFDPNNPPYKTAVESKKYDSAGHRVMEPLAGTASIASLE
jgi:hypothetical protein